MDIDSDRLYSAYEGHCSQAEGAASRHDWVTSLREASAAWATADIVDKHTDVTSPRWANSLHHATRLVRDAEEQCRANQPEEEE